ncbi:MAG: tRNA (adenosine(37)-N6)-threonylcarbamoyltransferase complex ATPase subunit type 1 TsaE [bacterium]
MAVHHTLGAAETIALGRALASELGPGDVVAFFGELGSGKTTMIKGIAAGLGVTETVRSPSFVIVTEYRGRLPVYHVDLYRLADETALGCAELDEYLEGEGVCLIEWSERLSVPLPARAWRVRIELEQAGRSVSIERPSGPAEPVE